MPFEQPPKFEKGPEEVPKSEEKKETEFLKEIELSEKEERLAEKGRMAQEKRTQKEETRMIGTIMKEEKRTPLEEKAKTLKSYAEQYHKEFLLYREGEQEQARDFFLNLAPQKIEKVLGKKELALAHKTIIERDLLLRQMAEDGLKEEELRQFVEEKGYEMLPHSIHRILFWLSSCRIDLNGLFEDLWWGQKKAYAEIAKAKKELKAGNLSSALLGLRKENKEWQKHSQFEREKEEKPMEIRGFESFDFKRIRGREIIETAAQILPRQLFSTNIKKIEYQDKTRPIGEEYGFEGKSFATFSPDWKGEKSDIAFHKTASDKVSYLRELPRVLAHEWGHSIDPRLIDQKDLSPGVQFQMILEWEKTRTSEPEWSDYVMKISNPDEQKEENLKSQESFAESCAFFLEDSERFRLFHPERYSFFAIWLGERFPEFDFRDREKCRARCQKTYSFLPEIYGVNE